VLKTRADAAMAVMADVARNPAFSGEELERQRVQAIDALQVSLKQPGSVASLAAPRIVFGDAPYGHPSGGTPESLAAMTAAELRQFHTLRFRPSSAVLVLTGQITPDEGFALAQKHFGGWTAPTSGPKPPQNAPVVAAPRPSTVLVDLPGSGQAAVLAALPTLPRTDPDYQAAEVGAAVLGGGYSSRLNQEIRIKRGLSYGAGASLSARQRAGVLTASTQTKNESAAEVADLLTAELGRLATAAIEAPELAARKSTLIGGFGRNIETVDGLAGEIGELALYGLPLTELEQYAPKVEAVTADQVRAVAGRRFGAEAASLIVVGDAKQFESAIKAKRPNAVTVPAANLDLDGPGLTKR
jgi:zinc protease